MRPAAAVLVESVLRQDAVAWFRERGTCWDWLAVGILRKQKCYGCGCLACAWDALYEVRK